MTDQAHHTAKLALGDKTLELPVYHGTIGPDVIDIRRLYSDGGVFTFDPGYTSTGSCESAITYIDGEKGELLYRGYPIEQLAEKSHFLEVAYLLLYGELPTAAQLEDFESRVTNHTMLHEQMAYFFRGFRRDAHPMAVVCGIMGAMSAFYHDSTDITDAWQREVATIRMIAKMPTIVAWAYKYSVGQPFVYPKNSLDYASNFLNMCFSVPGDRLRRRSDPRRTRWTGSSRCTPTTSRTPRPRRCGSPPPRAPTPSPASPPGVACLWGPAHGGANEACLRMLREIGTVDRIPEFIERAKDKDDPFRLMGFGHRVYKNFDPRAKVMKESADEVLGLLGIENNPTLQVAKELERIALEDELLHREEALPERRLLLGHHPRRDGLPDLDVHADLRARPHRRLDPQWKEMIEDPELKIGRPRQLYTGPTYRDYVDVERPLRPRAPRSPGSAPTPPAAASRSRRSASTRAPAPPPRPPRACGCDDRPDRQVDRVPRGGLGPPPPVPDRRRQPRRSGQGGAAGRRRAREGRRRLGPRRHRLRDRRGRAARPPHPDRRLARPAAARLRDDLGRRRHPAPRLPGRPAALAEAVGATVADFTA